MASFPTRKPQCASEAVLIPIFGEALIQSEKLFKAKLSNRVWVVWGSGPEGFNGGAAEIKFSKKTCEILSAVHNQYLEQDDAPGAESIAQQELALAEKNAGNDNFSYQMD